MRVRRMFGISVVLAVLASTAPTAAQSEEPPPSTESSPPTTSAPASEPSPPPLPPGPSVPVTTVAPSITVMPSTDLVDSQPVTVTGSGFTPGASVGMSECDAAGVDSSDCDLSDSAFVTATGQGSWSASFAVHRVIHNSHRTVDCAAEPGACVISASNLADLGVEEARAPISFGPAVAPGAGRYVGPVFEHVEVTSDVPYRETFDYLGKPIELHLDIYQPRGDTAARRPVIIWMHGGYFIFGDKSDMASYAEEFARRGYVAISLQYRLRHGMSTSDGPGLVAAAYDAYDDATTAVAWLESHADEYRIDVDNIAAGGYSAGAVTALNLAYLPGSNGRPRGSVIDAAASIVFHGTADTTAPYSAGAGACEKARAAGIYCELVTYQGAGHGIVTQFQRDIVQRTANFLFTHMINRPPSTQPRRSATAAAPAAAAATP